MKHVHCTATQTVDLCDYIRKWAITFMHSTELGDDDDDAVIKSSEDSENYQFSTRWFHCKLS